MFSFYTPNCALHDCEGSWTVNVLEERSRNSTYLLATILSDRIWAKLYWIITDTESSIRLQSFHFGNQPTNKNQRFVVIFTNCSMYSLSAIVNNHCKFNRHMLCDTVDKGVGHVTHSYVKWCNRGLRAISGKIIYAMLSGQFRYSIVRLNKIERVNSILE